MVSFPDLLLAQEHADALAWFLNLFEVRLLQASCARVACEVRYCIARRAMDVQLFVCGGERGDGDVVTSVECFTPATGQWRSLSPLPIPRIPALVELAGSLYAGSSDTEDENGSIFKFDPSVGVWESMPPLMIPRTGYKLLVAAGHLFVCGGICEASDDDVPCTTEYFDFATNLWCFVPPNDIHRRNPLVAEDSDCIYMCATVESEDGEEQQNHPEQWLSAVERFDAWAGCWETVPPMRAQSEMPHFAFMLSSRGHVYVGSDRSIERFDVSDSIWEVLPPMPAALNHVDTTEIAYLGRLFICGGVSDDGLHQSSFGSFCPRLHSWSVLSQMPLACSHPAVVGLAGCVYICGGCGGPASHTQDPSLKSFARFSLTSGSWEALPSMSEPNGHPEVVVSWGRRCPVHAV